MSLIKALAVIALYTFLAKVLHWAFGWPVSLEGLAFSVAAYALTRTFEKPE